ncbi:MAG: DHA2 family efflux MFS transporter permease subunit [Candidatus Omnitrophica bacterium]|nr:DHA2 family efflux MFS transporter permease subunit [Candidatus Omnitrophota bacterium]
MANIAGQENLTEPVNPHKWMVALAVMVGAFMAVMDISVVNVALPHMMGNFGQNISSITWVATAYSIAAVIMVTMSNWWSMLLGRKYFYLMSFVIFTVGSMLAGIAHTFPEMIIYRIIQGIGGGSLIPISQAIIRETFPQKEQGIAMAVFSMGVVVAPAVGPVLGGWLTDHYGWPWIFYINIPISAIGMLLVWLYVHDPAYLPRGIRKVDVLGIILLTIGLTGLQIVLERGQQENWFESNLIIWGSIITVITLTCLVLWEIRVKEPIVNFRVFKNHQFSLGCCVIFLFGIALFGTTFILPQFTQRLLNYPAYQAGLTLMPRAIALVLFLPLVGKLYNHVDPRAMMLFGITVVCTSYFDLAHLATSAGSMNIVRILLLMGAGMPFLFIPLSTMTLNSVARESSTAATGLFNLIQQVGGNVGYALMATLLDRFSTIHHEYLAENISLYNQNFINFYQKTSSNLTDQGLLALINRLVTQQAEMMAYNDISIVLMFMFLLCVPIIIFIRAPKNIIHTSHVAEI